MESFAEYCHKHYTGCMPIHNKPSEWEYCYKGEIVNFIDGYLDEKCDSDECDESVDKAVEIVQEQTGAYRRYAELLEWLYENDKGYDSVQAWREAFLEKLREVLIGDLEWVDET